MSQFLLNDNEILTILCAVEEKLTISMLFICFGSLLEWPFENN